MTDDEIRRLQAEHWARPASEYHQVGKFYGQPDRPEHDPDRAHALIGEAMTLRTLDDVAVELARLYRRAERGQIPTADASRLAYILTSLGKVIEASVIEARLTALEAIANEKP